MTPAVLAWPASFVLLATHAASVTDARLPVETPGPTRVYLRTAPARRTLPGVLAYHKRDEHHFIVPGRLEMELPPGHGARSGTSAGLPGRAAAARALDRHVNEVPTLLLAEDLNLAPTLADWVWEDSQRGQAPVTSDPIRRPRHGLPSLGDDEALPPLGHPITSAPDTWP